MWLVFGAIVVVIAVVVVVVLTLVVVLVLALTLVLPVVIVIVIVVIVLVLALLALVILVILVRIKAPIGCGGRSSSRALTRTLSNFSGWSTCTVLHVFFAREAWRAGRAVAICCHYWAF